MGRSPGPTETLSLQKPLTISLVIYSSAIIVSAITVWLTLWDLPHPWLRTLTIDALSKIYFWRWSDPFHFLRISLLYLEGIAAFFITLKVLKRDRIRALSFLVYSFLILGVLLIGYSAIDIFYRQKSITIYPGFGPVFTDRNAYAAFWVLYCPICLALALGQEGLRRAVMLVLFVLGAVLGMLSLSLSSPAALLVSSLLVLLLVARPSLLAPFRLSFYRRYWLPVAIILTLVLLLGFVAAPLLPGLDSTETMAKVRSRVADLWIKGPLQTALEIREVPWKVAYSMFRDHPLMGIGIGELYRNFAVYHSRLQTSSHSRFVYAQENAHNYLLQLAAETGAIGAGSFLFFFLWVLYAGWRGNRNLPAPERSWMAGFVGTVGGLAVFSLAQHPMLRFEFQIYFWVFSACILSLVPGKPSHPRASSLGVTAAVSLVLLGALLQGVFFPPEPSGEFQYGFREAKSRGQKRLRATEANAFLRTKAASGVVSFSIRNAAEVTDQIVRVNINGKELSVSLKAGEKREIREVVPEEKPLELGIQSRPVLPVRFADSWGMGVQIRNLSSPK